MLTGLVKISAVQLCSGTDPHQNLFVMRVMLRDVADSDLVVFPEATMCSFAGWSVDVAEPLDGPFASGVRALAAEFNTTIAVGMFTPDEQPVGSPGPRRCFNTLFVTGPGGDAWYHKLHLFDAFGFRESDHVAPGHEPVTIDVAGGRVGLALCYDVRFPELFKFYADAGAHAVVVPSSWQPGPHKVAQWRALARARALDSTCYVLACGQADPAASGRPAATGPVGVGHSVAAGPDGQLLGELGEGPGVLTIEVDPDEVVRVREALPVLINSRFTSVLEGVSDSWP